MKAKLLLLWVAGCLYWTSCLSGGTSNSVSHDILLKVESSGCYGPCPSYVITLFRNGEVIYDGRAYAHVDGLGKGVLSRKTVAHFENKLRALGFFQRANCLNGDYDILIYAMTAFQSGNSHKVKYQVSDCKGYEDLNQLADELEADAARAILHESRLYRSR